MFDKILTGFAFRSRLFFGQGFGFGVFLLFFGNIVLLVHEVQHQVAAVFGSLGVSKRIVASRCGNKPHDKCRFPGSKFGKFFVKIFFGGSFYPIGSAA